MCIRIHLFGDFFNLYKPKQISKSHFSFKSVIPHDQMLLLLNNGSDSSKGRSHLQISSQLKTGSGNQDPDCSHQWERDVSAAAHACLHELENCKKCPDILKISYKSANFICLPANKNW